MLKKILLAIGLCVTLYPFISNTWNNITQTSAVVQYNKAIQIETTQNTFEKIAEYNNKVRNTNDRWNLTLKDYDYDSIFTNAIGIIQIDKVAIDLPIYKGTDESVLQKGAGHFLGSTLPCGDPSSHAVLAAHTGSSHGSLFTNINQLKEGDTFIIKVLDREFTYQVNQIKTVHPANLEDLEIVEGKNYTTLTTCTPYGVNTHRLLVRGELIKEEIISKQQIEAEQNTTMIEDAIKIIKQSVEPPMLIAIGVNAVVFFFFLIFYGTRQKK